MDKKALLLVVAAVCVGLYFYGQHLKKDNEYLKYLPAIGGDNPQNQNQQTNFQAQSPPNNQTQQSEPSGLMKMVGQSLPFLPLLFEQFTGQKVPQISGTMAEIQMALQQVLVNQQQLNQRLSNLENSASQQFTNLIQQ
ncbi:2544_t:CDS:2, partial [Ambispora gerdemannii]